MDDLSRIPDSRASEPSTDHSGAPVGTPSCEKVAPSPAEWTPGAASATQSAWPGMHVSELNQRAESRRQNFLHNLYLLLSLTLAAFTLTAWILIRVDSPFGIFSSGPQEIVRAQLLALDRGDLRPAYDMFSARYRGQVSFDVWHELIVTHWRMFHAEVVHSEAPASRGAGFSMEIFLHGADDRNYRARFTLIHSDGRWWIDDVHWAEEPIQHDVSRI